MDNGTAKDFIEDLQLELRDALLRKKGAEDSLVTVAEKLDTAEALIDKLQAQNNALRDVVRSAQYLTDVIHVQHNASIGGTFGEALDNLKAALRSWYEPNGSGR